MQNSSATLLGLPPELRLQIYSHLFHQDLNIQPLDNLRFERSYPNPTSSQGSHVKITEVGTQPARFAIPWLNLTMSCKPIAHEVHDVLQSSGDSNSALNRTYEMVLEPAERNEVGGGGSVAVTWTRIPCPLAAMSNLVVHIDGVARAMPTALDLFFHSGLHMDRARALPKHMTLETLTVNLKSPRALVYASPVPGCPRVDERGVVDERLYAHNLLLGYHRTGKLTGCVGKVWICGQGEDAGFDVTYPANTAAVNGVRWGMGRTG